MSTPLTRGIRTPTSYDMSHSPSPLQRTLREFFDDFEWIHIFLGLIGNLTFFVGSIFFFYEPLKTAGIWLFVIGSFLMMVGSIGSALVKYARRGHKQETS